MAHLHLNELSLICDMWLNKITYLLTYLLKTILMDKKLRETTNLCAEIMNSKGQVKGKLGHVEQIRVCRLT